jgi:UDP-N-acetyl-D-mannosaminuronic acid dehydrogenase
MKKPTICVVGLGYIGLPTAIVFANQGYKVTGFDINPKVVAAIKRKSPLIEEPELLERLTRAVDSGFLVATSEPVESDVYIISVPTPVDHETKKPDLKYVVSATELIAPLLKKGDLVVLESTVPPGTVENVVCHHIKRTGLEPGRDIYVAHAPEKAIPGKLFYELEHNDRVIGGINIESRQRTSDIYCHLTKGKLMLTDATTAEMVKLVENTYRDVNIALANEFAMLSEKLGIDVWEVIEYANHHPRVNVHLPGPGVGGHCIAVDPWFLVDAAPKTMRLVRLAREVNDSMPKYVVQRVKRLLRDKGLNDAKVAVLGLTFKANIDDSRESPSIDICDLLRDEGMEFRAFDPYLQHNVIKEQLQDVEEVMKDADLMLVLVAHDKFRQFDPERMGNLMRTRMILDTKNGMDDEAYRAAGFDAHLLGSR